MWRTWQLCPIRSERKQGRHHQLIPWTILLFVAPFKFLSSSSLPSLIASPLLMKPPAPPCQRTGGGPKNYYSEEPNIQAAGRRNANNKVQQSTIQTPQVSESSQATFCLLTTNRTQSPDFLFSDEFFCSALCTLLVCLQIYSNACSEQDRLGWSPRLNLYWWPSTHPLALHRTNLARIIRNFLASDRAIDGQGFGVLSSQILSLYTNPLTGTNRRLTFPFGRGRQ